jgi:hypothetical protein
MKSSTLRKASGALFAPALCLCACAEPAGELGQGQFSLKVTGTTGVQVSPDADIVAGVMTIDEIRLLPSPDQTLDGVVVLDSPTSLVMTGLPETTTELVKRMLIPPGRYGEIRCILSGAYIDVDGEGIYTTPDYAEVPSGTAIAGELAMPSLAQSGLKIKLAQPLDVGPGFPGKTWVLRFDVAESFGHAAGDTKWVMHPVIFATDAAATASIAVAVDVTSVPDADKRFTVRLDDAENHPEFHANLDASKGYANAEMRYLIPSEGPFGLTLTTADGAVIATNPPLDQISLKAGQRLVVNATGIAP